MVEQRGSIPADRFIRVRWGAMGKCAVLIFLLWLAGGPGLQARGNVLAQGEGRIVGSVVNHFPGSDSGSVMFVDAATSRLLGSPLIVGTGPTAGIASPNGRWFYIVNLESSSLSIIHATQRVLSSLCLAAACPPDSLESVVRPSSVAVTPDGGRVLIAKFGTPREFRGAGLAVLNARTNQFLPDIPLATPPFDIVAGPDGARAYVTTVNPGAGWAVAVIDLTRGTIIATIPTGPGSYGFALAPDGTLLYVLDWVDNRLRIIDTSLLRIVRMIDVGSGADGLAMSPDGSKIYISHRDDKGVFVYDAGSFQRIAQIAPGVSTRATVLRRLAVSPDGLLAYVANPNNNNVSVLDLSTHTLKGQITAGENPVAVSFFTRPEEISEREPNNDVPQANPLSLAPGSVLVVKGTMTPATDVDLFAFDGRAGQQLVADVDAQVLGTSIDTTLALLNAAGQVVAENNDFDGSKDPYLRVTLPSDGIYFLRVQLAARVTAFQSGYELVLTLR